MKTFFKRKSEKTIFNALFFPLLIIIIAEATIFYSVAVYGGIENTMNQNAADIFSERLNNRKNELETACNQKWTQLTNCQNDIQNIYAKYENTRGDKPLVGSQDNQMQFILDSSSSMINTLRNNEVNGIFLIVNNKDKKTESKINEIDNKTGLCIRDLDQTSEYVDHEDLTIERAPSSLVDKLGCSLDSFWEARYSFESQEDSAYFYNPINAAWDNQDVDSEDIAYFQGAHKISDDDQSVVSYSIPLMDKKGYPYAVLGIELTTTYLASQLPNTELDSEEKSCYILAMENTKTKERQPIVGKGSLYARCFNEKQPIKFDSKDKTGGYHLTGIGNESLYGNKTKINIYNNNNPFEQNEFILLAVTETSHLFSYSHNIKVILAMVAGLSIAIGLLALYLVSKRFTQPITNLAKRVQTLPPQDGFTLGRLGILEIDQLVQSIEDLNRNASRNIARTEFFSRMSHDMRTPMNAIISYSSKELLEDTTEKEKEEYLGKIHSSGEYLLGLINEVLDMTKIESNKIDIHYEPISIKNIYKKIIPMIEKLAQARHVTFEVHLPQDDIMVLVDEQHFNQIIMNLLSNAVKFTPENGKVTLNAKCSVKQDDPQKVCFEVEVSDTGIGMSKEFMKNLYKPFEQEKTTREGTGLGLSIAHKLTHLMSGTIECFSQINEGTTFALKFVLDKCDESQIQQYQSHLSVTPDMKKKIEIEALKGKRILVCEDHPLNAQIVTRLLERVGIETVVASNGKIGLENFKSHPEYYYDAILMDIRMPVMNGLDSAKAIRSLSRKDAQEIPIIAMTANVFNEDVQASRGAGMNAHLSKPVEPDVVYQTLQELIRDKK